MPGYAGPVLPRVVDPAALLDPLAAALDGDGCVAPVRPGDTAALTMLAAHVPLEEPDVALVVATSGSTGEPKGVLLTRDALWASARATHDRLGGPGAWVCALPTHYVAGAMTLVRAHVAGTPVHFAAADLTDLPVADGRTYCSLVPTQLHRALAPGAPPDVVDRLAGYAAILVGGAAVAPGLLAEARRRGLRLVRTYGMTETCGGCVYDGVPLDGVTVDLEVDRVRITGDVVFSGYRGQPGQTSTVLSHTPAGRRFATADRGVWDDGRLQVVGRVDDVVVSGGANVDLAAVQRVVDAVFGDPSSGGVVVLGVPDGEWGTAVVAVTTSTTTLEQIRSRIGDRVAAWALPKRVRRVSTIPRTSSGKIDRQALASLWADACTREEG